jgi:hypothetical protein
MSKRGRKRPLIREPYVARPTILYHFTCRLWWRFIETEGINRGDTLITKTKSAQWPNLTTDPLPASQAWAGSENQGAATNKRAVRITVNIPPNDRRLISWNELVRSAGMDPVTYRSLALRGGKPRHWWIYRGVVGPSMFSAVDFLDEGRVYRSEQQMIDSLSGITSSEALSLCMRPHPSLPGVAIIRPPGLANLA